MGWLIGLAIVLGLAALPLGVDARYDTGGFVAKLRIGPIRIPLYPCPKKDEKGEDPKEKPSKSNKKAQKTKEEKRGGKWSDFMPMVDTALKFLNDLRKKLRVKRLDMRLTMAGDDPCDLAVNYGRAWAAVGNLMPQLEQVLKIKKRNIQVDCDFTAAHTRIYVRADLTITVARLLYLLVRYGGKVFKQYTTMKKGGAEK